MAEIASAYVSILPKFDAKKFKKEVGDASGDAGTSGSKAMTGKMSTGMVAGAKKIVAPLAAAFAAVGVVGFFKGAIQGASDLNETSTKIEAIFGDGSSAIQDFAANASNDLGQTNQAALDASATFGIFGKSAGLSGVDLTDFSTGLTGLATDLASFNNTSPEAAVQAIGSALRGESEPLRAYGVLLDDATLKARAMSLGLIETTTQALTPQQKVLAAQAEIYAQTGDAQGDFAKTSDGLANQQRILSASFTDMKTEIGAKFLPIVVKVTTWFNESLLPALKNVGGFIQDEIVPVFQVFWGALTGNSEAGEFEGSLGKINDVGVQLNEWLSKAGDFVMGTLVPAFQSFGGYLTGTVIPAIENTVNWVIKNRDWLAALAIGIGALVLGIKTWILITKAMTIATQVSAAAQAVWNVILSANPIGIIIIAIAALVAGLVYFFTQTETGKAAWEAMTGAMVMAWNWLWEGVLKPGLDALGAAWNWLYEYIIGPVIEGIKVYFQILSSAFGLLWAVIKPVLGFIGVAFSWLYNNVIKPVVGGIKTYLTILSAAFSWLWNNGISPVIDFIAGAMTRVGETIGDVFGNIAGVVKGAFNGTVSFLKSVINQIIGVINGATGGVNKLIEGVNKVPGVDFPRIPAIPKLAAGGIITAPTLAMVGEGRESEAVLPLSKLERLINVNSSPASSDRPVMLAKESIRELGEYILTGSARMTAGGIDQAARRAGLDAHAGVGTVVV